MTAASLTSAQMAEEINKTITVPCKASPHCSALWSTTNSGLVQSYPIGYPLQAAFQASEPSWSIYRAFSYLHARVILDLQDELRCLEEDLEELDLENEGDNRLRSRKDDLVYAQKKKQSSPRAKLIDTIRTKLVDYGKRE